MDSLKTLMDKKQYDLVIKLTENTDDRTFLFYRISAFLALGKPLDSLKVIEDNRHELEKDLSILVKIHIEILCLLSRFDDAYKELDYYKNLPYVSQQVEELFAALPNFIREEERKTFSNKEMSNDEVKSLLHSSELNDSIIALDIIRERDINNFIDDLRWALTNHQYQSIRSFSLFVLVQKKINQIFRFKHIDKIIEVNPSTLLPPFTGPYFNEVVNRVTLEFNNPSLSENAIQILSTHIMFIYPEDINYSTDEIIEALYQISSRYLQSDSGDLKQRCLDKQLDVERVSNLIDDLNFSLENF